MIGLCDRCTIINAYSQPSELPFTIEVTGHTEPIPYCDDWGDVMDNIPVVRDKINRIMEYVYDLQCFC